MVCTQKAKARRRSFLSLYDLLRHRPFLRRGTQDRQSHARSLARGTACKSRRHLIRRTPLLSRQEEESAAHRKIKRNEKPLSNAEAARRIGIEGVFVVMILPSHTFVTIEHPERTERMFYFYAHKKKKHTEQIFSIFRKIPPPRTKKHRFFGEILKNVEIKGFF